MVRQLCTVAIGIVCTLAVASPAQAQWVSTWVSGTGDDGNPCLRDSPCRTFAGAMGRTVDGGLIHVLDPADYGTLFINKSITINGDGSHAGIVAAITEGITINAAGAKVTLRNLAIGSPSVTEVGTHGIRVLQAAEVRVENVWIGNVSGKGIDFSPSGGGELYVDNVTIANCGTHGIYITTGRAMVKHYKSMSNFRGLSVEGNAIATVTESYVAGGYVGFTVGTHPSAILSLERSVSTHNQYGAIAGNAAAMRLRDSMVISNTDTGLLNDGTAAFISLEGNSVVGNSVANGNFTGTIVRQ